MSQLPAILIGGPPHSGKTVLAHSLSRALRQAAIDHYVLRAYPDGEGDWSNEADPALARALRRKGNGNARWVAATCCHISRRHLPLLVDAGGKPTPEQESIFAHCTHSILLAPTEAGLTQWQTIAARHGLTPLAELRSTRRGQSSVRQAGLPLRGTIAGLERGQTVTGPTFNALAGHVRRLLTPAVAGLRDAYLAAAPAETAIDIERLCRTLTGGNRWQPHHLPTLLNYLPEATPLAVYGRAPGWVISALARHAQPADFFQFDPRLGWITPPSPVFGPPPAAAPLQAKLHRQPNAIRLQLIIQADYLPPDQKPLVIPTAPPDTGIIIDGKIPHWLTAALARRFAAAPWLAVFQPQLNGAVVVRSDVAAPALGTVIAIQNSVVVTY